MSTQYDITAAERVLREAADAYYNRAPIMSDAEFDRLLRNHRKTRTAYPEEFPTDTILDKVGAPVREGITKIKHRYPMLSLDNVFEAEDGTSEDLRKWLRDLPPQTRVTIEPKLDGISLSVVYLNGVLARAVTRGDGSEGEDVTAHVLASGMVPSLLYNLDAPWSGAGTYARESIGDYFEVRGEVVMSWDQFEKLQAEKEAAGETLAANPRNAAAGAMGLKNPAECAKRGLEFVAYQSFGDLLAETHASALLTLDSLGFRTVSALVMPAAVAVSDMKQLALRKCNYPVDGLVIKVDSYRLRNDMGFTSRAPRWATALKFQQEKVTTTLKAITVQVGRSGVLTPVAELEPVWVDGSTVRRATLHNEDHVNRLGLYVGARVVVEKAGAIIPSVVGLAHDQT